VIGQMVEEEERHVTVFI